jgi:hypothetical protein
MNEQEQQVIDILADNVHEMCAIDGVNSDNLMVDADMDGVQTVAREICTVFKPIQKDTRSRRERALDAEFERMGVKPRVYHFTKDMCTFNVVTVALAKQWRKGVTENIVKNCVEAAHDELENKATAAILILRQAGIYGVSICDRSDVFSKRYGRMKAKGRLLQHLLKEENK